MDGEKRLLVNISLKRIVSACMNRDGRDYDDRSKMVGGILPIIVIAQVSEQLILDSRSRVIGDLSIDCSNLSKKEL